MNTCHCFALTFISSTHLEKLFYTRYGIERVESGYNSHGPPCCDHILCRKFGCGNIRLLPSGGVPVQFWSSPYDWWGLQSSSARYSISFSGVFLCIFWVHIMRWRQFHSCHVRLTDLVVLHLVDISCDSDHCPFLSQQTRSRKIWLYCVVVNRWHCWTVTKYLLKKERSSLQGQMCVKLLVICTLIST